MTENQQRGFAPSKENLEWVHAIVSGHWRSQAMRAAVQLSLAEHLAEDRLTAAEVAAREGSDPDATFRLMRACVSLGLLIADHLGRFYGTPMLAALRGDVPGSLRGYVLDVTMPSQYLAFTTLTDAVFQGHSQAETTLGPDSSPGPHGCPDQWHELSGGWSDVSNALIGDVAALIPTAGVQVTVDVGGDNSTLLDLLMEKSPGMQGIVLDRPKPLAPEMPPADLYLLTCALRDWDDETCAVVLRRCREAMRPGGRVAVVELIVGEITDPGPAALLDLNRLATVAGRERSLTEYDALLRAAGLLRTSVVSANRSPYGVIEATAC